MLSKRTNTAVVLGVYGKGNFGDEALLESVANDLQHVMPGCEICVFCSGPAEVTKRFGLQAELRTPASGFFRKLGILRRSRLLVVGGGTLLCDHGGGLHDAIAVITYFFWAWLARLLGVPVVLYGQGFGPSSGRLIRLGMWLTRHSCDELTARDTGSFELVTRIAGWRRTFHLGADPVLGGNRFLPAEVQQRADPRMADKIEKLRPYVLLAVRHPKFDSLQAARRYLDAVGQLAARLCSHAGTNVVLFPTHLSATFVDDRPVMDVIKSALVEQGVSHDKITAASWESLHDAAYWLQQADMVFGDRLHALLVAALNRVPVAGVVVEDKIRGCLKDLFQERPVAVVLGPDELDSDGAAGAVLDLWDRRGTDQDLYLGLLEQYRARHGANINALVRALRSMS